MKFKLTWCFFLLMCVSNAQILFEDQALTLGLDTAYGFGHLGGGISFYDYNDDGWDDITLSTGPNLGLKFYRNEEGTYRTDPLSIFFGNFEAKQVIWVDYDNDGDNDFFVVSNSSISKLYNNDNNNFTDVTLTSGLPIQVNQTFGASWGDINNDGYLDVFFSIRDTSQTTPNLLYKNNGDGTFTNITVSAGLETTGYLSMCAAFFDYDNDGFQDIFVANDKYVTENLLYKNNGDETFTNVSAASGTNLIMGAMSTTIDDYNNDGWLDIYVTNDDQVIENTTTGNAFLQNNGDGTFTNVAIPTGTQFNSVAWGSVFLDADNDEDHDLYVSSSEVTGSSLLTGAFYENDGNGNFTIPNEIGFQDDNKISYSNAMGDVDNDGYPEILVCNWGTDLPFLWKNQSPQTNNWIKIKLEGTTSNKMGIGSWIEVSAGGHVQYHYTLCGEGFLGQNSAYEFFGLSTNNTIDYIKVTWLSGQVDYLQNVNVNQAITIVEGGNPLSNDDYIAHAAKIYPNPASHFLNVEQQQNIKSQVTIYTISGSKIDQMMIADKVNRIDLEHLDKGIYFVKIKNNTFQTNKKLIIN